MPVAINHNKKLLEVCFTGKLGKKDYARLVPAVNDAVGLNGRIRMLVEMHDFHGWTLGALWDEIEMELRHFCDIERIAIVGEKNWQKGMTLFSKPFHKAEVRYFEFAQAAEARDWLKEGELRSTRMNSRNQSRRL